MLGRSHEGFGNGNGKGDMPVHQVEGAATIIDLQSKLYTAATTLISQRSGHISETTRNEIVALVQQLGGRSAVTPLLTEHQRYVLNSVISAPKERGRTSTNRQKVREELSRLHRQPNRTEIEEGAAV